MKLLKWHPIATVPPYRTVLLYRTPDLYPVVGCLLGEGEDGDYFALEEGGPEDGEHRRYPALKYKPTHWAELPETPDEEDTCTPAS